MKDKILNFLESIRTSLWLVPSALVLFAIVLSEGMLHLDDFLFESPDASPPAWLFSGGPDSARQILATIAGAVATVASLVFTLTMITFTLASSQYGPRLLRNFMADRTTQFALGAFVGTFVYCLMVLRQIRSVEEYAFTPEIAVTVAIGLSIALLGMLLYYIHHIAQSIEVETVVYDIGQELGTLIDRMFPDSNEAHPVPALSPGVDESMIRRRFDEEGRPVPATGFGYIQTVDYSALVSLAVKHNVVIRLRHRSGHFVVKQEVIADVLPGDRAEEELAACINRAMILGRHRTPTQDIEYAVDQLVEIAVIALSPGINGTFTAISCIDRLGNALSKLAGKVFYSPYHHRNDVIRLVTSQVQFRDLLDASINQIRQGSRNNAAVSIRLLEVLEKVARQATEPEVREAVLRQATMIDRGCGEALPEGEDRQDVHERFNRVVRALQA